IWGAAGRFGYVPVQEGVVYWFACKNAPQKDQTMSQWSIRELRANFETYGNTVKTLLDHTAPDTLIWSDIIDLKPIHQFAFGRIALLGDAAHATTPNLGQGACQGIEDALALQKALLAFPENDVKALQHFQQTRLKRTHQIVNTSWRLGKLAQIENAIITVIRNGLFRAIPEKINIRQTARILGMS
ncbi:MAG: FAD-dependent monooxygenase, partial [Cyclobacteriaceae bacterium]|nr:FAD-dependent monooxygenase [Cyclobacteriaceae bacterium]